MGGKVSEERHQEIPCLAGIKGMDCQENSLWTCNSHIEVLIQTQEESFLSPSPYPDLFLVVPWSWVPSLLMASYKPPTFIIKNWGNHFKKLLLKVSLLLGCITYSSHKMARWLMPVIKLWSDSCVTFPNSFIKYLAGTLVIPLINVSAWCWQLED